MNIQQLEYIVALDTHRHFVTAAEKCHVTQATLSMMIKKLELELGVSLFDRSQQPVTPTDTGEKIIVQARLVLMELERLFAMADEEAGEVSGELRLGIIPTVAPYLLPLFLEKFLSAYPKVKLKVSEMVTEEIVRKLRNYDLDAGILATPLSEPGVNEVPLFYEEFVVYASSSERILEKNFILASDIDPNRLWLLEEGHCLRSQIMNICELRAKDRHFQQLEFESGSIETLKRIVEVQQGITVLPKLALRDMPAGKLRNVRAFRKPAPVREIALVYSRISGKEELLESLKQSILSALPPEMRKPGKREIVAIEQSR